VCVYICVFVCVCVCMCVCLSVCMCCTFHEADRSPAVHQKHLLLNDLRQGGREGEGKRGTVRYT
jgi:hypothetical protein